MGNVAYELLDTPAGVVVVKLIAGSEVARTNAYSEERAAKICLNLRWARNEPARRA